MCASGDASAPRMMLTVHLFQTLAGHVSVDLRSRQITVTQQHLYDAQVRAVIEQMRGERVPQGMRRELLGNTGFTGVALDEVPEGLARHPIAPPRREQVVGLALEQNLAARAVEEFRQPTHGFFAQGNQPLAVALAHDANDTLVQVDLPMAQVD